MTPTPPASPDRQRRTFSTGRLEAFSDGVFAIAITLLILNVVEEAGGSPLEEFLEAWPSYVGYVVSFLTIGVAWIGHASLTDDLDHVDSLFLRLNLLLLMVVVFLPFPTSLVTAAFGDRDAERVAVTVYGATLLGIRLMGIALDRYSAHQRLYARDRDDSELLRLEQSLGIGLRRHRDRQRPAVVRNDCEHAHTPHGCVERCRHDHDEIRR